MTLKLLKYYLSLLYWSRASVAAVKRMQLRKFRELFEHARRNSRFYREFYGDHGLLELEITSEEDIRRVPLVNKGLLREHPLQDIMTRPMDPSVRIHHTSGSTGEPFAIAFSEFEDYSAHVRLMKALGEAGYTPMRKMVLLSRYEPGHEFAIESDLKQIGWWREKLGLFRRELISIFDPVETIIRKLETAKPYAVWSTPSIIEVIALALQKADRKLDIPLVLFMSETVTPALIALFRERIGREFIDLFGCMESPAIGFGINQIETKKLFSNTTLVEVVIPKPERGLLFGDLVITNLINHTMPIIRYDLGDRVEVLERESFPVREIGRIHGRSDDIIYFGGRYTLTYHQSYQLFRAFHECLQYRFIERAAGEIVLQLRIDDRADREQVKKSALLKWEEKYPGYPLTIEWKNELPIDRKTGKFKVIERFHHSA